MAKLTLDAEDVAAIAVRVAALLGTPAPAPTPTPVPPVVSPPVPAGVRISARWDALGNGRQWAKWNFVTSPETVALQAVYDPAEVSRHINWYGSYHRLDGRQNADGTYDFVDKYIGGQPAWVRDQGGSADARHLAGLMGVPQIGPLG